MGIIATIGASLFVAGILTFSLLLCIIGCSCGNPVKKPNKYLEKWGKPHIFASFGSLFLGVLIMKLATAF